MVVNIGKMKDVELVKTSDKDLFLTNKKIILMVIKMSKN